MKVEVRILDERLPAWGFPGRGSALSAGIDIHACLPSPLRLRPGAPAEFVASGFAVRIGDPGWCGLIAPRSGSGHRGLVLGNTVGIIDADYEGEILLSAWNRRDPAEGEAGVLSIAPGERIAQLLFVRVAQPELDLVESFSGSSARGGGGFGSTGTGPGAPAPEPA